MRRCAGAGVKVSGVNEIQSPAPSIPHLSTTSILRHPNFEAAFAAHADALVALSRPNSLMRGLMDFRQTVCFQLLVCFDAARDPDRPETLFTTAKVAAAMAMLGVKDRRAIADLIGQMREDGYVTVDRAAYDRRVHELRATDKARRADREWLWSLHLPLSILEPDDIRYRLGAQRDVAYQRAFRIASLMTLEVAHAVMADHPEVDYFAKAKRGSRVLFTLVGAVRGRADRTSDPGFYGWAAERCGISRPHVRKLLKEAEARGLVILSGQRAVTVQITPVLDAAVRRWTAAALSATDLVSNLAQPGNAPNEA